MQKGLYEEPRRFRNVWNKRCVAYVTALFILFFYGYHYHRIDVLQPFPPAQILNNAAEEEWVDDMPYREQTPWDISTDYPYSRSFEFDVHEGTWLRLDVHPKTGDIIFDMLGDIYCIPANEAYSFDGTVARARPVLSGIPYDVEPRFSPEGDRLAFRSDAELGLDNLWIMPWSSCEDMDLRPPTDRISRELAHAQATKDVHDQLLADGMKETRIRRENRLIREGRLNAQRVSNETWRTVTGPRFHPSGRKIIGTKWFQGHVTLGAPEGWEYPVPNLNKAQQPSSISKDSGKRIIGHPYPPGKSVSDRPFLHVGPEQFVYNGEDGLIYAKNTVETWSVGPDKDPFKGILAIYAKNLTTGREKKLVDATPGSAMRPEISRDGRTLAFVRRFRDHDVLALVDLRSGTIRNAWHGLSTDFSTIWSAPSGSYPSFGFSPSDDAIIIWARGQIYHVPLSTNELGEKVASGTPQPISFSARVETRLAETRKASVDIAGLEAEGKQRVHALRDLRVDETGSKAVLQAAGVSVLQVIGHANGTFVPVLHHDQPYLSPSFVPGFDNLVVHVRWSDANFSSFEVANTDTGAIYELTGLPLGRYFNPTLSPPQGDHSRTRRIAFVKSTGDPLTGSTVATADPGVYIGNVVLPDDPSATSGSSEIRIVDAHLASSNVDTANLGGEITLKFTSDSNLVVHDTSRSFTIDLSNPPVRETGEYDTTALATGKLVNEVASSGQYHAFVEYQHVYVAKVDTQREEDPISLSAKPHASTKGLARVTEHGGHSVTWSGDGKKLFWLSGPYIYYLEVAKLKQCDLDIESDPENFGIRCASKLVERQEVYVEYPTEQTRFQADVQSTGSSDVLAIVNAKLLTMATGDLEKDFISNGTLLVQAGVIRAVGYANEVEIPSNATQIDAGEAFVIPGFFDAHAHWYGCYTRLPAKSWELQTFLAYGVTTVHNPSCSTVNSFVERVRVESGMTIGPRIFNAGTPIFAGLWPGLHAEIVDEEEAYSTLYRIKAEGGPYSHSAKNYQIPSRAGRQRLLKASKKLDMVLVPEGGSNFDWGLTYIIDGFTTHEHNLPVPVLYEDVMKLFALSGTGYTPTWLVFYGGPNGENWVWDKYDITGDEKLRNFAPYDTLASVTQAVAAPEYAYTMFNASNSAAQMARMGVLTHIGAHGEPPKGHNYHAEMFFAKQGGMTNYEVLQAATSNGPKTFGLFESIGSLSPGKLADFLVYAPGVDLLNGPIDDTKKLRYVARGGRIWDATTMVEEYPVKGRKQRMPMFNAE